jgi:hypothetical protein
MLTPEQKKVIDKVRADIMRASSQEAYMTPSVRGDVGRMRLLQREGVSVARDFALRAETQYQSAIDTAPPNSQMRPLWAVSLRVIQGWLRVYGR